MESKQVSKELRELDEMTKEELINFLKIAMNDSQSPESIRLYYHLLKVFTDADKNFNGRIDVEEFTNLIETAAFLPRKHGIAPHKELSFKGDNNALKERRAFEFATIDVDKSGTISFDEFLGYCRRHIKEHLDKGLKNYLE